MGASGHPDDTIHPPQRHHPEPTHHPVVQRPPVLVPAHQERPGDGQGLVHVSSQHGPHADASGVPPSCW